MSESVIWRGDTPYSPRFDDVYRTTADGLAQARQIFLHGCGLLDEQTGAWAPQRPWRILETGFGLGLNFLAAWHAWHVRERACTQTKDAGPGLLHFVSIEAYPVTAQDILRGAAAWPELAPLAEELARQWQTLEPGETCPVQRLSFAQGRVLLTLCLGDVRAMLRELRPTLPHGFDSVFLDGFNPQNNADMWSPETLRAITTLTQRHGTLASWTASGAVRRDLTQCGWQVDKVPGLPPKRESIRAVFDPSWALKVHPPAQAEPRRCAVIGAGLAGAAAAASLARRGWQVTVLDAASISPTPNALTAHAQVIPTAHASDLHDEEKGLPAARASDLPVGLFAPHVSPDDNLLSRLTRAGIRQTLQTAHALTREELLHEGVDWSASGVLDRGHTPAIPHALAGWMKPAALARAWLAQPGITVRTGARVERMIRASGNAHGDTWRLLDAQGQELVEAELVIVAAACASAALLQDHLPAQASLPLNPVRGQISWGPVVPELQLPPMPVNGNGHFIPCIALGPDTAGKDEIWLCGSTYERGETNPAIPAGVQAIGHAANFDKLGTLLPEIARQLAPAFARGQVRAWSQIRCASRDRRPLVGFVDVAGPTSETLPSLGVLTALGSRGLSFAALSAELLAARLHGEPLPLPRRMAQALDVQRVLPSRST